MSYRGQTVKYLGFWRPQVQILVIYDWVLFNLYCYFKKINTLLAFFELIFKENELTVAKCFVESIFAQIVWYRFVCSRWVKNISLRFECQVQCIIMRKGSHQKSSRIFKSFLVDFRKTDHWFPTCQTDYWMGHQKVLQITKIPRIFIACSKVK